MKTSEQLTQHLNAQGDDSCAGLEIIRRIEAMESEDWPWAWQKDFRDGFMSKDEAYLLGPDMLKNGSRIWWYFKEDKEFAAEHGTDAREYAPFSGIVVCKPDAEVNTMLEVNNCLIIMDTYPVEKCNCEATYMTMERLLDADGLVEVFYK